MTERYSHIKPTAPRILDIRERKRKDIQIKVYAYIYIKERIEKRHTLKSI